MTIIHVDFRPRKPSSLMAGRFEIPSDITVQEILELAERVDRVNEEMRSCSHTASPVRINLVPSSPERD